MDNFFQSDKFYEFLSGLSFLEVFRYEVERDGCVKGRIVGYIQKDGGPIKSFFSRRAIVNGGPMFSDDITNDEVRSLLNMCVKDLRHKTIYVEFRNFDDYSAYRSIFEACGFKYEPHYDMTVDTTDAVAMEGRMAKHIRRYIRLSLREGVEVVDSPSISQVRTFYEILKGLYRTKIKTPLFSFEFFERAHTRSEFLFLLILFHGEIIGGICCLLPKKDKIYGLFSCGQDGRFKNVYPSSMVKYAVMRYANEHGYRIYDMMGAGSPGDGGYGVRDFKAKFGGKLVEYGRYLKVENAVLYGIGVLGVKILKMLK